MEEKQVLQEDELKTLQEQQQKYAQTLTEIGSIEVAIANLKEQLSYVEKEKEGLFGDLKTLRQQADEFQKNLLEKYGDIDVNINTGEFTSLSK